MYVKNIQAGLLPQNAARQNSGSNNAPDPGKTASNRPAAAPQDRAGAVQGVLQSVVAHIDYVKQQLDTMLKSYPPFFPAGSPQRMDWINEIRDVQDEVGNIADEASGVKHKLDKDATDEQISAAIKGLLNFREEVGGKGHLNIKV